VKQEGSRSDERSAEAATEAPVRRSAARPRAPADTGYPHPLRRWVEEGAERPMSVEELCDYLDSCPESAE
jgi:hypothetical protein